MRGGVGARHLFLPASGCPPGLAALSGRVASEDPQQSLPPFVRGSLSPDSSPEDTESRCRVPGQVLSGEAGGPRWPFALDR